MLHKISTDPTTAVMQPFVTTYFYAEITSANKYIKQNRLWKVLPLL